MATGSYLTPIYSRSQTLEDLVFGYHFDMSKRRMLTQVEIEKYMNDSGELSELSEDGLEYSDDDVDF
ncbi:hypothetical protein TNCV_751161 [Trichonephila clavipes]|nr:hypothetical protein TNCV_751161 [Trichonephila clavipes]